jgi:2-hydroxymuconate-semialdehyde hydrolase
MAGGAPEPGHFVDVDGVRTHYHDRGSGPAILLLHGSGPGVSAWANWRQVMPALEDRFRVIAPDQIGFGDTDPAPDGVYGRVAWTRHAIALMDTLEIDRFSVIGNSMGGAIALSIAAEETDRVERVVVMGTTGAKMDLPAGLDRVWGYTPSEDGMRELMEMFAFDRDVVTDSLVTARYEQSLEPRAREAYEAMFPAPRQRWIDDLALPEEDLRRIERPVLMIHGRDDRVIPLAETTLRLLEILPDVEAHIFGACGHWVQVEKIAEFNTVVRGFLGTPAGSATAVS